MKKFDLISLERYNNAVFYHFILILLSWVGFPVIILISSAILLNRYQGDLMGHFALLGMVVVLIINLRYSSSMIKKSENFNLVWMRDEVKAYGNNYVLSNLVFLAAILFIGYYLYPQYTYLFIIMRKMYYPLDTEFAVFISDLDQSMYSIFCQNMVYPIIILVSLYFQYRMYTNLKDFYPNYFDIKKISPILFKIFFFISKALIIMPLSVVISFIVYYDNIMRSHGVNTISAILPPFIPYYCVLVIFSLCITLISFGVKRKGILETHNLDSNTDTEKPIIARGLSINGMYFKPVFDGNFHKEEEGKNPEFGKTFVVIGMLLILIALFIGLFSLMQPPLDVLPLFSVIIVIGFVLLLIGVSFSISYLRIERTSEFFEIQNLYIKTQISLNKIQNIAFDVRFPKYVLSTYRLFNYQSSTGQVKFHIRVDIGGKIITTEKKIRYTYYKDGGGFEEKLKNDMSRFLICLGYS